MADKFEHPPAAQYVFVTTQTQKQGKYAIVTLNRAPVNGMNKDVWEQLLATLTDLEADKSIRGAIFCSGLAKDVFTAGNDINELYVPHTDRDRHRAFWLAQTNFLARLLVSPLATAAAIRGACPAGGCVLAMCCDERVITHAGSIGLNEVALGISPPKYWMQLMINLIGFAAADRALQCATMFSAKQALQLGLVDQVVTNNADLMPATEQRLLARLKFPDYGRVLVKQELRGKLGAAWEGFGPTEAAGGFASLSQPATMASLGAVLARLSGKKPAAKL